jgi:hypothetical protein
MFPMCTSNDPARFALKGNFPHHLEYSNHLHACVLIPAWGFRLYYVEDWPRFVKFLCAHERAGTNIGPFFFSETTHVRKPGLQTFKILNSHDPMECQGCFEIL